MLEIGGWEISQQALLIGAAQGLGYALLATGMVLIYRATGVVNFAQAEIGAFASTLTALLLGNYGVNFWPALAAGVVAGAGWAAAVELVVVRRLFRAPRVVLLIATVGAAQLVFLATLNLPSIELAGGYPTAFDATWTVSDQLRADSRVISLVVITLPVVAALAVVLTRSRFGLSVRAAAENAESARLIGISPRRVSTIVWAVAGGFAGLTAVLLAPFSGGAAGSYEQAGPELLLRILAVALLARMRSLPVCIVAGLGVGVGQAVVLRNMTDQPGAENLFLFVVVLAGVLLVVQDGRTSAGDRWLAGTQAPVVPDPRDRWWVRRGGQVLAIGALGLAALVPVLATQPSQLLLWSQVVLFAVVVVSATILAGWAGQLSLGQFAFFGLGAGTTVVVSNGFAVPVPFGAFNLALQVDFSLAVVIGTAVGAGAAALVGLPALRVQGLMLAVATLAFAAAAETWLFRQDVWTGGTGRVQPLSRPAPFESPGMFYLLCLALLAAAVVAASWLRRRAPGRALIAVRDNEQMAAANGLSPARVKLAAFAFSGGLAALAGGLYALLLRGFTPANEFTALRSLDVVAMAVIGGLGSIPGAVLGAAWVLGLPALFGHNEAVRVATSGLGLLVLLLYLPGGLAGVGRQVADAFLRWRATLLPARPATGPPRPQVAEPSVASSAPAPPVPAPPGPAPLFQAAWRRRANGVGADGAGTAGVGPDRAGTAGDPGSRGDGPDSPALRVVDLDVRFGNRVVVEGVSLEVAPGELVALIGANGAGKSTLMDAVSGFVPATGTIEVHGRRIDALPAFSRHGGTLARGFQAAGLYRGLTVRETVLVALGARAGRLGHKQRGAIAEDLIDHLGLGRYADQLTGNLSTGARRIVELTCLLAVGGRLLLLDEPTAGVAQREAELFGPLIQQVQRDLDAAVLLVEHDMPLVMGISDRVYCLETGRVIAEGAPQEVRANPAVVATYLGVDERAINRSGRAVPSRPVSAASTHHGGTQT